MANVTKTGLIDMFNLELSKKSIFLCLVLSFPSIGWSAVINQLTDPTGLTLINDFESTIDDALVTWDATATLVLAADWASGGTPSGLQGLLEREPNEPLQAFLAAPAYQAGFWFGNDENPAGAPINLGIVTAQLDVFDGAALLGSVELFSNRNDFADQFLGLSSDSAFDRVAISYHRPAARQLAIYIDDFYLSSEPPVAIAAPTSPGMVSLALVLLASLSRRSLWIRKRAAPSRQLR